MQKCLCHFRPKPHLIGLFVFLSFCATSIANAQALGDWTIYLPYKQVTSVQQVDDITYCGTETSLWSYNASNGEMRAYSKLDGFSDLNISDLAYSESQDALIIAYESANIDILFPDQVLNVPDIKRKIISGGKKINDIYVKDSMAYFSCSFGLVVYDIATRQFPISPTTGATAINQVAIGGEEIYAATPTGLKQTSLNNPFLNQLETWTSIGPESGLAMGEATFVQIEGDLKFTHIGGETYKFRPDWGTWEPMYSEEYWRPEDIKLLDGELVITEQKDSLDNIVASRLTLINGDQVNHVGEGSFSRPRQTAKDANGVYWVGDFFRGLGSFENGASSFRAPNGPRNTDVTRLALEGSRLWVAPGTISGNYSFGYNPNGLYTYEDGSWKQFERTYYGYFADLLDLVRIQVDPFSNRIYAGSIGGGLLEMNSDGTEPIVYRPDNSIFESEPSIENSLRISGMSFDAQGDLWVCSYLNSYPIVLKTRAGEWQKFSPTIPLGENKFLDIIVDDLGQKWIALDDEDGLLVFDSGEDPLDTADDTYRKLNVKDGNTLKSGQVFSMAKDLEGDMWIGTGDGVIFYSCYGRYGQDGECISRRPEVTVDRDEFTFYLMAEQIVQAIAVDGANRKWIGTRNGVWLMSPDGTEQVLNFNIENSPLLSNDVKDIVIDHETGEVYFGTAKGIVSYRGDAVLGGYNFGEVLVYPNPVRPEYQGNIAIKGMAQNANVKITDISGTLVYETTALGGQAVWNAKDYNGERASSGVYLLFCANEDGTDTYVGKFLIVN